MSSTTESTPKEIVYGKVKTILLPSGRQVDIREQNGNDDDILSNPIDGETGANISKFIAAIVVKAHWKTGSYLRLTYEEARELLVRDRFCIIFHSRIHSIGEIMKFSFDWGEDPQKGGKFDYEEDLRRYLWDYTDEFPEEYLYDTEGKNLGRNPDYDPQTMSPYASNCYDYQELTTQSGKTLRFKLFNGTAGEYMLKLPAEAMTKNTELKARGLEYMDNNNWVKVENFSMFSSRDMSEIRTFVNQVDSTYNPITEITHPVTKEITNYPIMYGKDFFYQEGI